MASLFQIHIDIPRTNPLIPLFQQPLVQEVRELLNTVGPPPTPTHLCSTVRVGECLPPPPTSGRFMANHDGTLGSQMELWFFRALSCGFSFDPRNKPVG